MGRAAKIARAALFGSLGLTIALVAALDAPAPRASVPAQISEADAQLADGIARCRTVTRPDPECEAAWEARRRQFFGRKEDAR